jgi:hypothetical protein
MRKPWLGFAAFVVSLCPAAAAVEATWGLDVLGALARDKSNVVIPILKCRLEGFIDEKLTFRVPYVRRSSDEGRVIARVPVAGTFYPGFQFYDGPGDERISIRIDGVERGIAVANTDDNRDRLFFLSEPYRFRGGETIELRTLTRDGIYRTEDLILLKEKPPARRFDYKFNELFAQPRGSTATLTWITSWPARCNVESGKGGESGIAIVAESIALSNHRVTLTDLQPGREYRFRIIAKTREGRPVASEWRNFRIEPPAPIAGTVRRARLPLRLKSPEDSGLGRLFPVRSGVPLPKGALGSDLHLRLLDPSGQEVPLQTGTLAYWPDGSLKWVLLDFQAHSSEAAAYTLEYGSDVTRRSFPSPLRVTQSGDRISVTTGPLRFAINKRRFGLLESLSLDNRALISAEEPGTLEVTAADGRRYSSLGAPEEVLLEEAGPVRTTIRVRGHYRAEDGRGLLAYTVLLDAYAGQRFVRIRHTWGNDSGEEEFTSIRALRLRLPLIAERTPAERGWTFGGSPGQSGTFPGAGPVHLRQHTDDHYAVVLDGGGVKAEGRRAPGWAEWRDGARRVTLAVRDFWQTYPKDLTVAESGFELGICPPLRGDEYAAAKGTVDEHRLYYYLQDGLYRFRQGMSQTQDIWLEAAPESDGRHAAICTQREPLQALAPPRWYADTKALGELAEPGTTGILGQYDRAFALSFAEYWKDRDRDREYGMLNFGDWWGERVINWGNSEYDMQHALLMQFLRTGDVRYFSAGEQMEWHNRDVDTIHHHRDPSRAGGVYHHAIGHTGGYYGQSPVPGQGIAVGILTVDHVFVRGHLDYYFLTGDRRSLETARLIADRYGTYDTRNYDFNNTRNPGWHLLLTMAVYEATQDRFYLNAAKIIVERVLERQTPDGGWDFYRVCMHPDPPHFGNFNFTVGVLLTGLQRYYAATGDERAADEIVRGSYFLVDKLWTPDAATFRYTSCPEAGAGSPMLTFLVLEGVAFAHQRTQDPRLGRVLISATQKAVASMASLDPATARANMDGVGKELGLYVSSTPHFIGYVAALEKKAAGTPKRGAQK